MCYKKILIVAAVLIAAFTQLQAQPAVATINVDALTNLAKTGGGEAGGALFLPDGNIIALWKGRPLIVDSKSGEIIRNLDALASGFASSPEVTKDGTRLVTKVTGPKLAVWDIQSGKIIHQIDYDISYFCLSPDGTKLFVTLPNKAEHPGIISIYDMITFKEIETLSYFSLKSAYSIDISPDGLTLAVSVGKTPNGSSDTQTNQVVLINLNDKENY
ncbi:MAG: WD40 repeat domain-containing protein, partial [bacterium]